jgi:hypothetical protein
LRLHHTLLPYALGLLGFLPESTNGPRKTIG